MWRRVRIYLFGVALGCVVVWALLIRDRSDRTFDFWLPEERVLEEIRSDSTFRFPAYEFCLFRCYGFNSLDWERFLQEADVDFSRSMPRQNPRIYFLTFNFKDKPTLNVEMAIADSSVAIRSLAADGRSPEECDCNGE